MSEVPLYSSRFKTTPTRQAEGFGKMLLASGDTFEGEWRDGKKTGKVCA